MTPEDGVIGLPTELKLGASADGDVRSETITGGVIRRIPDPVTNDGQFAQMILWAYDDPMYFVSLSALDLDVAAIQKAVRPPFFSRVNIFFVVESS